jgi:hypothetical protein
MIVSRIDDRPTEPEQFDLRAGCVRVPLSSISGSFHGGLQWSANLNPSRGGVLKVSWKLQGAYLTLKWGNRMSRLRGAADTGRVRHAAITAALAHQLGAKVDMNFVRRTEGRDIGRNRDAIIGLGSRRRGKRRNGAARQD